MHAPNYFYEIIQQVRHDVVEMFGLPEPHADRLVGCCGEVSQRIMRYLLADNIECGAVFVKVAGEFAHTVVASGHHFLDGTVTQFTSPELMKFAKPCNGIGIGRFVYLCPELLDILNQSNHLADPWVGDYPVGPITHIRPAQITQTSIDAGRGYIIRSYPSRFSEVPGEPGGMAALCRAAHDDDVEWRRAVATVLVDFPCEQTIIIADILANDIDPDIRTIAREVLGRAESTITAGTGLPGTQDG